MIEPIRLSFEVACPADHAFEVWTGEVTIWEPPTRLGYLWHLRGDGADATEVEIQFIDRGDAPAALRGRGRGIGPRPRNQPHLVPDAVGCILGVRLPSPDDAKNGIAGGHD